MSGVERERGKGLDYLYCITGWRFGLGKRTDGHGWCLGQRGLYTTVYLFLTLFIYPSIHKDSLIEAHGAASIHRIISDTFHVTLCSTSSHRFASHIKGQSKSSPRRQKKLACDSFIDSFSDPIRHLHPIRKPFVSLESNFPREREVSVSLSDSHRIASHQFSKTHSPHAYIYASRPVDTHEIARIPTLRVIKSKAAIQSAM